MVQFALQHNIITCMASNSENVSIGWRHHEIDITPSIAVWSADLYFELTNYNP